MAGKAGCIIEVAAGRAQQLAASHLADQVGLADDLVAGDIFAIAGGIAAVDGAAAVASPESIKNKRVLVVEDGPTLTHGEMPYGAGVVAARQCGAAELVDPRPYAVGSIRGTYEHFPHLTSLLPAMGYSAVQRHELQETINRTPCDLVLVATPIDLAHVIKIDKPSLRVSYEVEELTSPGLAEVLAKFPRKLEPVLAGAHK